MTFLFKDYHKKLIPPELQLGRNHSEQMNILKADAGRLEERYGNV